MIVSNPGVAAIGPGSKAYFLKILQNSVFKKTNDNQIMTLGPQPLLTTKVDTLHQKIS